MKLQRVVNNCNTMLEAYLLTNTDLKILLHTNKLNILERNDMPTLRQYRLDLGWSITMLAGEARISRKSVMVAEKGGWIQAPTAKAISSALSRAYRREIKPWEIEGLNIL
ncbi:hypothetical protein EPA93_31520 [Ktedonosporobacter rubrisoli]|uniref:Uncharacterized protein n=1 Tax=Ktedonosporobacter rubrisoli TaxID=2509675 RepID=A0A4P6JXK2_KTERU|nr:hypothetical protein [Ktedonosporobacter rubrisoli]QBD80265.1 hypothetical protein EPA93_31520 [Ktedonosporobacter rubrisoli]